VCVCVSVCVWTQEFALWIAVYVMLQAFVCKVYV